MPIENTLSIIKPDIQSKEYGSIYTRFAQANLKIIAARLHRLTLEEAEGFYSIHRGRDYFPGLIQLITSGPSMIQVLSGENAIQGYRELIGPTDPTLAPIGSLRATFGGGQLPANGFHGSDSAEAAAKEIKFFFEPAEVY
jgi:nucleoside-diphosphate kinase